MKNSRYKHHRCSTRLKDYDYSQAGAYFITICVQNRVCLFGDITDGEMVLNDAGRMIKKWFFEIAHKFHDIRPDVHVVMPNHFHCIVVNVGADLRVCPDNSTNRTNHMGEHTGSPLHGHSVDIIGHSYIPPGHLCEHPGHMGKCPDKLDENHDDSGEHTGSHLHKIMQWYKTMTTNEYIKIRLSL